MPTITAKPTLGHCGFCGVHLAVAVAYSGQYLLPFGECRGCRRFTIWQPVDVAGFPPAADDVSVSSRGRNPLSD